MNFKLKMLISLTGHCVISSGHSNAPVEAGDKQYLKVNEGKYYSAVFYKQFKTNSVRLLNLSCPIYS